MNKEETIKAIKVMQAFVDGKTIVISNDVCFLLDTSRAPVWNWYNRTYTIKPEPIERWIAMLEDEILDDYVFNTERACEKYWFGRSKFIKAIKLVEVQEPQDN